MLVWDCHTGMAGVFREKPLICFHIQLVKFELEPRPVDSQSYALPSVLLPSYWVKFLSTPHFCTRVSSLTCVPISGGPCFSVAQHWKQSSQSENSNCQNFLGIIILSINMKRYLKEGTPFKPAIIPLVVFPKEVVNHVHIDLDIEWLSLQIADFSSLAWDEFRGRERCKGKRNQGQGRGKQLHILIFSVVTTLRFYQGFWS